VKVYKVVRREDDQMLSVWARHSAQVAYQPGQRSYGLQRTPVYAFGGALAGFSYAHDFASGIIRYNALHNLEIWECEAKLDEKAEPLDWCLAYPTSIANVVSFHKGEIEPKYWTCHTVPNGTILCQWIRPIRKVWPKVSGRDRVPVRS